MSLYLLIKVIHILSATVMVGTGFGTAFYLFWVNRSGNIAAQAVVSRWVAIADWCFTTPAVIIQPLSGLAMMHLAGWTFDMAWIYWTLILYSLAGACWLPVVWLQLKMRDMANQAHREGKDRLPETYRCYQRYWEWLGYPAFLAMMAVYFLMVIKPM